MAIPNSLTKSFIKKQLGTSSLSPHNSSTPDGSTMSKLKLRDTNAFEAP